MLGVLKKNEYVHKLRTCYIKQDIFKTDKIRHCKKLKVYLHLTCIIIQLIFFLLNSLLSQNLSLFIGVLSQLKREVISLHLFQINTPFSESFLFLEIQDFPTFHRSIRKIKMLNNLCNQFVYNFYPQSILILEE